MEGAWSVVWRGHGVSYGGGHGEGYIVEYRVLHGVGYEVAHGGEGA